MHMLSFVRRSTAAGILATAATITQAFTSTAYEPGDDMGLLSTSQTSFVAVELVHGAGPYTYYFTVGGAPGSFSHVLGDIDPVLNVSIASMTATGPGTVVFTLDNDGVFATNLLAGSYALTIDATGFGFTGDIRAQALGPESVVPEANSAALAIAGLAVSAALIHRRRRA